MTYLTVNWNISVLKKKESFYVILKGNTNLKGHVFIYSSDSKGGTKTLAFRSNGKKKRDVEK